MCMSKKIYTNTLLFFALLVTASPLKTFLCHSLHSNKNLKKIEIIPDSQTEMTDILFKNFKN